jgi:hypothetical protein
MVVRTASFNHGGLIACKYRFQHEEIHIHCIINKKRTLYTMVPPRERWNLNTTEPQGLELFKVIPKIKDIFIKAEWYDFMCTFEGHHIGLAILFTQMLDGFQNQLGDTWIHITEHFIGASWALHVYGERWFKKGKLPPDLCNKILVPENQYIE